MKLINKLTKSHLKIAQQILKHKNSILYGTVLAIDPGSHSMGYTLQVGGQIIDTGSLPANKSDGIALRLDTVSDQLLDVLKEHRPVDVLLIELVRTSTGHHYLTWSAGNAVRDSVSPVVIEIPEKLWSKAKDVGWFKCDALDSRYILEVANILCREDDSEED